MNNKQVGLAKLDLPGAEVYYIADLFSNDKDNDHDNDKDNYNYKENDYFQQLDKLEGWEKRPIFIFGRECYQNRKTIYFGETGTNYRYSGINNRGNGDVPDVIRYITGKVETFLVDNGLLEKDQHFNYWLGNHYKDGNQNIGMHSDDERDLIGPIVSLSFGSTRYFDFRQRENKKEKEKENNSLHKLRLNLEGGSLLFMGGETQRNYLHGIPLQKKITEPRINITLRIVKG